MLHFRCEWYMLIRHTRYRKLDSHCAASFALHCLLHYQDNWWRHRTNGGHESCSFLPVLCLESGARDWLAYMAAPLGTEATGLHGSPPGCSGWLASPSLTDSTHYTVLHKRWVTVMRTKWNLRRWYIIYECQPSSVIGAFLYAGGWMIAFSL